MPPAQPQLLITAAMCSTTNTQASKQWSVSAAAAADYGVDEDDDFVATSSADTERVLVIW